MCASAAVLPYYRTLLPSFFASATNLVPLTVSFSYAIDECLELCADRAEIDGRGEDDYIRLRHLVDERKAIGKRNLRF